MLWGPRTGIQSGAGCGVGRELPVSVPVRATTPCSHRAAGGRNPQPNAWRRTAQIKASCGINAIVLRWVTCGCRSARRARKARRTLLPTLAVRVALVVRVWAGPRQAQGQSQHAWQSTSPGPLELEPAAGAFTAGHEFIPAAPVERPTCIRLQWVCVVLRVEFCVLCVQGGGPHIRTSRARRMSSL